MQALHTSRRSRSWLHTGVGPLDVVIQNAKQHAHFFQFETLGTYILTFGIDLETSDKTIHPVTSSYTFHVGPLADLEVRPAERLDDLYPGRQAYVIEALNNGLDMAPEVKVQIDNWQDVSGAYAGYFATNEVDEHEPMFDPVNDVWTLGELHPSEAAEYRPGIKEAQRLVIYTDGSYGGHIDATIENHRMYRICIYPITLILEMDVDVKDVEPKVGQSLKDARTEAAQDLCAAANDGNGGEYHETVYFDYYTGNNTATIASVMGKKSGAHVPQFVSQRKTAGVLVEWFPLAGLYGLPLSHCQIERQAAGDTGWERLSGDLRPGGAARETYVDTRPRVDGVDYNYRVRGVSIYDHYGPWNSIGVEAPAEEKDRGVMVTPRQVTVAENGGTATYEVSLDGQPTAPVTLTATVSDESADLVNSDQGTAGKTAVLTFTTSNWNQAQTVTVTGVNDDVDIPENRRRTVILNAVQGGGYDHLPVTTVQVSVTDDDKPGNQPEGQPSVTVSRNQLTLAEGGDAQYSLTLSHAPESPVRIKVTSSHPDVDVSAGQGAMADTAQVSFSPTNWRVPQKVTVHGADDAMNNGGNRSAVISHEISDGSDRMYTEPAKVSVPSVAVTLTDDEAGYGVTLSPMQVSVAEGREERYTIALNARPAGRVRVALSSSDESAVTVTPASLTFTTENWSQAQEVTVIGVDDGTANAGGSRRAVISHTLRGGGYQDMVVPDVVVSVGDLDSPGLNVSLPAGGMPEGELTVSEYGSDTEAWYTLALSSRPREDVTVELSVGRNTHYPGDPAAVRLEPGKVTFTPGNWHVARTIRVHGVDDNYDNKPEDFDYTGYVAGQAGSADDHRETRIIHTARTASRETKDDNSYHGVSTELTVKVLDDDEPTVSVWRRASGDKGAWVKLVANTEDAGIPLPAGSGIERITRDEKDPWVLWAPDHEYHSAPYVVCIQLGSAPRERIWVNFKIDTDEEMLVSGNLLHFGSNSYTGCSSTDNWEYMHVGGTCVTDTDTGAFLGRRGPAKEGSTGRVYFQLIDGNYGRFSGARSDRDQIAEFYVRITLEGERP